MENISSGKIAVISGAGGMDAKTLTHFLLKKSYRVILTYRRNSYFDEQNIRAFFAQDLINNPKARLHCEVCDIADQNSVNNCLATILRNYSYIDELYMLAANSHVGESFHNKDSVILVNGQSYYYFLEFLAKNSSKTRVYGALTSEVAGNVPDGFLFNEDTCWSPKSPYGYAKQLGSNWIKLYRESKDAGLFACFGILFNHSNQYRSKDFFIRKVTNSVARIELGKQTELKLGHLDFYRDEHWSDFGCEAMWKMLQLNEPTDLVIATGKTYSGEEFLQQAFSFFNLKWQDYVKFDKSLLRPNEVPRLIGDSSKAQKLINWNPNRMPFQNHIELMCTWDYQLEDRRNPIRPNVFELFPQ